MTIYRRRATVHYGRFNGSILDVDNLSTPSLVTDISAHDLLAVYNTSFAGSPLGFSCNTAGAQFILFLSNQLIFAETSSSSFFSASASLRNLAAMPLYYFSPLYLSPYTAAQAPLPDKKIKGVQPELYVDAALSTPEYHITVASWSIYLYASFVALMLLSSLAISIYSSFKNQQSTVSEPTTWPVVGFVTECTEMSNGQDDKMLDTVKSLRGHSSRQVVRDVDGMTLYRRLATPANQHIVTGPGGLGVTAVP